jgi:hypothetical protein
MSEQSPSPKRAKSITVPAQRNGLPLTPQWRDNPGGFPEIPDVPEPILGISDPALRQRVHDSWLATCRLRKIIDVWRDWFEQLEETGDADPSAALRLRETSDVCIETLFKMRADIDAFKGLQPKDVAGWLPVEPFGQRGWQKDEAFIQQEEKLHHLHKFQGQLMGFMNVLVSAPSVAFLAGHEDSGRDEATSTKGDKVRRPSPNEKTEQPIIDALYKMGAVGLDGLKKIPRENRPTGERLAPIAVGRHSDGQFKATLAHMVDLGWLDNGRNHGLDGGYFLTEPGAALATQHLRRHPRSR